MPTIGNALRILGLSLISVNVALAELTIPVIGRPSTFSGAAGSGVKIEATAEPTEFTVPRGTRYTLTVRNLLNAADVPRPDLGEWPEFRMSFQVEPDLTPVVEPEGTRLFRYHLRPHRPNVDLIPAVEFTYYDPKIPQPANQPSLPFRKTRASAIPIRIQPDEAPPPRIPIPLEIPAFAAQPATPTRSAPASDWWISALLAVPLGTLAIALVWRVLDPASLRAARRRRSRAMRDVLNRLRQLAEQPPDPHELRTILASYVAMRYGCSRLPATPHELAEQLKMVHVPDERTQPFVAMFGDLDEFHFAPNPVLAWSSLLAQAVRLIETEEAHA